VLRVTVLGSGTCVPRARRGPAGYAVESADLLLLVDSGSGTLGRLHRAGYDFRHLRHVFYTHTHVDHTADLPPLLFATNYTPGFERTESLHLCGPPGFRDFVDRLAEPWPWIRPTGEWLAVRELDSGTVELPGLSVRAAPVEHGGISANAYRIEAAGRSVAFSGDTCICTGLIDIAREADLLVIEASFPEAENAGWHLTAAEAGRVAARAGARSVLLTHLYPSCDRADMVEICRREYAGPVRVAEDLMVIDVGEALEDAMK
jgi:ribonuclease BN (tRNA processing enzyme)